MKKIVDEWVKIGVVGVDSGQLMVCDPCYVDREWRCEDFTKAKANENFSYNAVCHKTLKRMFGQLKFVRGHSGVAVAFATGVGDGCYPVFARVAEVPGFGRRVCEVKILFV